MPSTISAFKDNSILIQDFPCCILLLQTCPKSLSVGHACSSLLTALAFIISKPFTSYLSIYPLCLLNWILPVSSYNYIGLRFRIFLSAELLQLRSSPLHWQDPLQEPYIRIQRVNCALATSHDQPEAVMSFDFFF